MTQGRATPITRYVPWGAWDDLVWELGDMVRRGTWCEQRDALAMLLGLHGLRVTEVRNLTRFDFDVIDGHLRVATLKRGRPRTLTLGAGVARAIEDWRGGSLVEPLAISQWERFCRDVTSEVIGPPGLKFHACRHTAGVRGYQAWRDPMKVRKRLGHASLNSTTVYIDAWLDLDDEEVERIGTKIDVVPTLEPAAAVKHLKLFAG